MLPVKSSQFASGRDSDLVLDIWLRLRTLGGGEGATLVNKFTQHSNGSGHSYLRLSGCALIQRALCSKNLTMGKLYRI